MSQILTNALATYKAQQEAAEEPIVLDQIVFAYVPGIDPEADIDPDTTLPDESFIVYRYDIPEENKGFINPNAVVYSCLLGSDIGTWTYNSIYLINSDLNLAASIITTLDQTKVASNPTNGIEGDTLVRNIVTTYSNAQKLTGISVTAETWQLDFTSRLSAIDERIRQVNLDEYGQAAFFEDGWKITHTAAAISATVSPGVGYVGGLKSVLDSTQTLNLTGITLPKTVYLVSTFQGQTNSAWETSSELRVLDALEDTFTEDGNTYYSAPIARLSSSTDAEDLRTMNKETDFVRKSNAATNADIDAESTAAKHINLPQLWRAFTNKLTALKAEDDPFPQYLHNNEAATNAQAIEGTNAGVWMSALRSMEQLKSRISSKLDGTRTDYSASEDALRQVNEKADYAYNPSNLPPYTLMQTIDLIAQDSSLFYPLVLNGTDNAVGSGWVVELASRSGAASAPYNATTLVGYLRGSGYSDRNPLFDVNVSIYDKNELTIHSAWEGGEGFYGVVIYLRGGTKYYLRTNDIAEVHTDTDFSDGNSVFPAGLASINTDTLTKASLLAEFTHTGNYNNIGVFNTENPPTPAQVGAVPTTRTINDKALDKDISLTPNDIGALKGKLVNASFGNQGAWIKIATAYLPHSSATIKIDISGGGGFNAQANYQSSKHQIIVRSGNSIGHSNCRLHTQDLKGCPFREVGAVHIGDSEFDIYAKSNSNYSQNVIVEYTATNTFTVKNEVAESEPAELLTGDVVVDFNSNNPPTLTEINAEHIGKAIVGNGATLATDKDANGYKAVIYLATQIKDIFSLFSYNEVTGIFTTKYDGYYKLIFDAYSCYNDSNGSERQYSRIEVDGVVSATNGNDGAPSRDHDAMSIKVVDYVELKSGQEIQFKALISSSAIYTDGAYFSIEYARPLNDATRMAFSK